MALKRLIPVSAMFVLINATVDDREVNITRRQTVPTCTDGYERVKDSTMCLTDSPLYIEGTAGISDEDKDIIVNEHNKYRAGLGRTAKQMPKLYWDDGLAKIAEKWAKQCVVGHEKNKGKSRFMPKYGMTSGQNGGFGYSSWADTVKAWYDEISIHQWGIDPKTYLKENEMVGHFTQVVQDTAVMVGCGYTECNDIYKRYYFCNYLQGQTDLSRPYTEGPSCSGCPSSCNAKLCDCNGVFCYFGGTLDINSCQCSCKPGYGGNKCLQEKCDVRCLNYGTLNADTCKCQCTAGYSGEWCETEVCPTKDPDHCGSQWPSSYCTQFGNVPKECPIMCGSCPK